MVKFDGFVVRGLYSYYSRIDEGFINGDIKLKEDIERMNRECDELLDIFPGGIEIDEVGELDMLMVSDDGSRRYELLTNIPFSVLSILEDDEFGQIMEVMQTHNGDTIIGNVTYKRACKAREFIKRRVYKLL